MENIKNGSIRKVYLIYKTHLDVGFTDFAQKVLERYVDEFIPKAIRTARICNADGEKRFVWTVGSYIIHYYLEHADPSAQKALEDAIYNGDITWHGLALTTETEVMDRDLFQFGIELGKRLEERFGIAPHIAAKMTDVPGHTEAVIPILEAAGVRYIHIGINGSSRPVEVPELCVWKYGDSEIILNYAGYYGRPCILDDIALEFAHSADNMGPPTADEVFAELDRMHMTYPNAEIIASSLDDFANEVLKRKANIPVVEGEMGDTWIHIAATDPWKSAMHRRLLHFASQWREREPGVNLLPQYRNLMENLLLASEHTCGLDCKKYLYDFKNWDKNDFKRARTKGCISRDELLAAGELISQFLLQEEFPCYTGGRLLGGYDKAEQSWEEQRKYLLDAMECLPHDLQTKAKREGEALIPMQPCPMQADARQRSFNIDGCAIDVQPDGSLSICTDKGQRAVLGQLRYETYSAKTVEECYFAYNRNFKETRCWAEPDFSKPGMQYAKTAKDQSSAFRVAAVQQTQSGLQLELVADREQVELYGCPQRVQVEYCFCNDEIQIRMAWFDKDANHMPEALFFGFCFEQNDDLRLYKLNQPVDPYQVLCGGNRKLHACQRIESKSYILESTDAPVVSVGGRHLYDVDDMYGDIRNGLHFLLYNNRWNTNCPVYYDQNAAFAFRLKWKEP